MAALALLSRLITDRILISQFLFWLPLAAYAVVMLLVLMCALCLALVDHFWQRRRKPVHQWAQVALIHRRLRRAIVALAALCVTLASTGWMNLRTPLAITPGDASPQELRILHWNLSSPDTHTWPGIITDVPECRLADVMLLGVTMSDEQFTRVTQPLAPTHHIRRLGTLAIMSRYRIEGLAHLDLRLDALVRPNRADGSAPGSWYQDIYNTYADQLGISRREFGLSDPGDIISFTVNAPSGPVRIWFIDLPSTPFASRRDIARATIERAAAGKLPLPHLVMGDFNMPGGSHSMHAIAPGYRAASEVAPDRASGPTWPRAQPILHIDHALVHPTCPIRVYRTFDPGLSDHWGQFLTFTPVPLPTSESFAPAR
jgi:hypothetical protein